MPHIALYRRRHYVGAAVPAATISPIPASIAITAVGATATITGVTRSIAASGAKTVSATSSNTTIATVTSTLAIADGATTSTGAVTVTGVAGGANGAPASFTVFLAESGGGPTTTVSGTVTVAVTPAAPGSFTISSMAVAQGVAINRDLRQGLTNATSGGVFTVDGTSAALPSGLSISGNYLVGTTNAAAVPNNGIKLRYTAAGAGIVSNAFPIYVLANTAFDSSGRWTPARDPDGTVAALRFTELPLRTWVEVANSNNMALLKPIYDALGETIYTIGSDGYLGKFTNFSGCAIEPGGRRTYFHGGGHEGGSDNSVDEWDTATLGWRIIAHPSKVGRDGFTAEDLQIFSDSHRSWDGTGYIRAYSRSSTGFAAKVSNSLSFFAWIETNGPARYVSNPSEICFINNDSGSAWTNGSHPVIPIDAAAYGDVMPDHLPVPRHVYGGFIVGANNELLQTVRQIWRCKLDGSGWVKSNAGGRYVYPDALFTGELAWVLDDPPNNRVLKGGCGSNCPSTTPAYFYYGAAVVINKTTFATSTVSGLVPSTLTISQLNMGDSFQNFCSAGRLGVWINSLYASSYNLDTAVATGFDLTGTSLNWNSEGRVAVHVPALQKILRFDTYAGRGPGQEPLTCYAMDDPQHAGAVGASGRGTLNIAPFAIDATALPNAASLLQYNRIWLYNGNTLVYVPFGDTNVFVCRVV